MSAAGLGEPWRQTPSCGSARPCNPQPWAARHRGGLAGWQLRRLNALALGDLLGLTVPRLACEVRLSVFHFTRAFSASVGVSPGRWLTRARVEQARRLLEATDRPVGVIARTVGYRGAPQLNRAFQAQVGLTPSGYRRRS